MKTSNNPKSQSEVEWKEEGWSHHPNFRTYCKVVIIKTLWFWAHRPMEQDTLELDAHTYHKIIFHRNINFFICLFGCLVFPFLFFFFKFKNQNKNKQTDKKQKWQKRGRRRVTRRDYPSISSLSNGYNIHMRANPILGKEMPFRFHVCMLGI